MTHERNKAGLRSELRLLRFLWTSARGHHAVIVATLILQVAIGLMPAAITYYIQRILSDGADDLLSMVTGRNLLMFFLVMLVYILLKEAIAVAQSYAMTDIKRSIERRYIRTLSSMDYATVHDRMDNRDVMAITRESEMVTMLLPSIYRSLFGSPITILAFVVLLLVISPRLTLAITLLIAVVVACSVLLRRAVKGASRQLYRRLSDIHVKFAEWLRGYKVFMLYGASGYMRRNMDGIVDDTSRMSKALTRIQCCQSIAVESMTYLIVVVFIWLLGHNGPQATISALVSFPTAILFIRDEAIKITRCYTKVAQTESAVTHLLRDTEDIQPVGPMRQWSGAIHSIAFDDVTFGYADQPDSHILDHCDLRVDSPGLYLLIGPSGIGKSTCLDLLMGLRVPLSGTIRYNDRPIGEYDTSSLLSHISYVEQEPFLFEGTIRDNLSFGQPIDTGQALAICRDLHLDHIVSTPDDLDKAVAPEGRNLSCGERQRLAFVRAMLKRPDVVILDEATSNVDTRARDIMVDYMVQIARDRIVISVSHDEYLKTRTNNIITLDDAKLRYTQPRQ